MRPHAPTQLHDLVAQALHALHGNLSVEVLADQGDADVTDDIDDVAAFPKAVIQLDCALARPANCRDYHAMADDAPWPTEAEERDRAARPTPVWKSTTGWGVPTKLQNSLSRSNRSRFG